MRESADAETVRRFLAELGRLAHNPATIYLTGGATAVLEGWRSSTNDIDIRIEPESDDILHLLPDLKERLEVNVELASPLDFLPEPPAWRDNSPFFAQEGPLTVRHIDPTLQALAKIERGFMQDLGDVAAMLARGLTNRDRIGRMLDEMEPFLFRYPVIDPAELRAAVDRALE